MPRSVIGAAILLSAAAVCAQSPAGDAGVYRRQLDAYLLAYEPQLSSVVADELMTQRSRERQWVVNHRRIRSEVAFIALPGNAGWMGFRRVLEVNGKAVNDAGAALGALIEDGEATDYQHARRLLLESAAYNLGAPRTINLPNLPLELLHPRHRQRFAQELYAREKVRGTPAVLLRFEEREAPTIIQQAGGGDMKTVVWAWVEPDHGRLLRAKVTARDARMGTKPFLAEIDVRFNFDKKVGMLVPAEMTETFFVDRGGTGTGTARYSNYRQFKTAARVVPQ